MIVTAVTAFILGIVAGWALHAWLMKPVPRPPRIRGLVLLAAALSLLALGGGEGERERLKRELVIDGVNFPADVVVLVDKSASMGDEGKDAIAVANAIWVAKQAGDAARVRFAVFSVRVEAWFPGDLRIVRQGEVDRGPWLLLPDADGLAAARAWLRAAGTGGGTNISEALRAVFAAHPDGPLGVVLVTDEDPDGIPAETAEAIAALNERRRAVIGCIAVKPRSEAYDAIGCAAAKSGGAFLRITPR